MRIFMNHFHLLFVSRTLLAMLTATILLSSLCGCASMPTSKQRSEIENNIDRITAKTCQKEMVSFLDLGPRPSWKKEAISQAQNYLEARLRQMDYQVEREPLPGLLYESRGNANIIAEKTGTRFPDQILEISAHFDSLDNMGADDNASGVIGVLEIARILKNLNCERTIRFCLFDCEEVGLVGSEHHVTRILKDSNRKVIGLINLEMIGYSSSAPDSQIGTCEDSLDRRSTEDRRFHSGRRQLFYRGGSAIESKDTSNSLNQTCPTTVPIASLVSSVTPQEVITLHIGQRGSMPSC